VLLLLAQRSIQPAPEYGQTESCFAGGRSGRLGLAGPCSF
jgi:hypothetical protein